MEQTMTRESAVPFGWRDKLGYLFGDFGCNMSFVFINSYMMLFFVTCLGLDPKIFGVLIFIAKAWDAVNDPIIGAMCDATHPQKGSKFKPWMKWGSFPLLLCSVLMFLYAPGAPAWLKYVQCFGTYFIWSVAYTSVNVPYGSLQSVITKDPMERTELSNARSIGAMLAQAPLMVLLPLFLYDDKGNPKGSLFVYIVAAMGVIGFFALTLTRHMVTERVVPKVQQRVKFNYFATFASFLKNKPMLGVTLSSLSLLAFMSSVTNTMPYIFMCYFQDTKLISVGVVIAMSPMVLAMLLVKPLTRRFTKRQLCTYPFLLSIAATALLTFVRFRNPYVWLVILAVSMFSTGFYMVLTWAMVADCIDYQEERTGRREEGSIYATYSMFRKLAQGLGQAVIAWGLGMTGYLAAGGAQQAPGVAEKIYTMTGAFVLLGSILCFISMFVLYKFENGKGEEACVKSSH